MPVGATLWSSPGRGVTPERDRAFRDRLVEMLEGALAREHDRPDDEDDGE